MNLRPLSVGEILDAGIKLYLRNWTRLVALVAVVVIPIQVIDAVIRASVLDRIIDGTAYYLSENKSAYLTGSIVILILTALLSLLVVGGAFRAVSEAYLGHDPSVGASMRFALRRVPSLLWMDILLLLGVAIGFVLFIVPGIYLLVAWTVAVPVLMVEGIKGPRALGRSRELVSGRWWATLGVIFVGVVIPQGIATFVSRAIVTDLVKGSTSVVTYAVVLALLNIAIQVLLLPITASVTTVLYYDLRVRKEGFDLAVMIDALGLPAGSGPTPAPVTGASFPTGQPAPAPAAPPPSSVAPPGWDAPITPDIGLPEDPDPGVGLS